MVLICVNSFMLHGKPRATQGVLRENQPHPYRKSSSDVCIFMSYVLCLEILEAGRDLYFWTQPLKLIIDRPTGGKPNRSSKMIELPGLT